HRRLVADVEGGGVHLVRTQRIDQGLQAPGAPAAGDHAPAGGDETFDGGAAEAGCRAGDECGPGHGLIVGAAEAAIQKIADRGFRRSYFFLGAGFFAGAVFFAAGLRALCAVPLPRVLALVERCFCNMSSARTTSSERMPAALAMAMRAAALFSSGLASSSSRMASRRAASALRLSCTFSPWRNSAISASAAGLTRAASIGMGLSPWSDSMPHGRRRSGDSRGDSRRGFAASAAPTG